MMDAATKELLALAINSSSSSRTDFSLNSREEFKNLSNAGCVNLVLNNDPPRIKYVKDGKDDDEAADLKNRGNALFSRKKYIEALEVYTRSIAKAKSAEVLAVSYGNRSAALFNLKLYKECLEDIERALGTDSYPEKFQVKLIVRRRNANKLKTKHPPPPYFQPIPSLCGKPNPKIQSPSNCVQIKTNQRFGRHVVATRNIEIGDVISVEKPFSCVLLTDIWTNCHECTNLSYNPIPCDTCTLALFCGQECKLKALERYHQYECPILASIHDSDSATNNIYRTILRTTLVARESLLDPEDDSNDNCYRSDRYREIRKLTSPVIKKGTREFYQACKLAAEFFLYLRNYTRFFEDYGGIDKFEDVVKESLLFHSQICYSNLGEIEYKLEGEEKSGQYQDRLVAAGLFPFMCLFNHSCHPNVVHLNYGNNKVLRACRTIEKGEQCFIAYACAYTMKTKMCRQLELSRRYAIDCKCRACEENWSVFVRPDYLLVSGLFYPLLQAEVIDVKLAKSVLGRVVKDFRKIEYMEPLADVCFLLNLVELLFAILGNTRGVLPV